MSKLKEIIKGSLFLRGLCSLYKTYFGVKRSKFGYCAKNALPLSPIILVNPKNIFIYEDCKIGPFSEISAPNARFVMKRGCGTGNHFTVMTGNHYQKIGRYYRSVTDQEKKESGMSFDNDVVVNEDVWIGCNVTLLSGVEVGRGAVLAAGAVISKNIPPYAIAGGVPAKVIKFKWDIDTIMKHEAILYPENERFSREQLEKHRENFKNV